MKNYRFLALVLSAVVLSGCANASSDVRQRPESSLEDENVCEINPVQLNEYLSKGYNSENVTQYFNLNVYECSLMQLDKNAFLDLFSEKPIQNGSRYSTDYESGNFIINGNTKPETNEYGEQFIGARVSYCKNEMTSYRLIFDYFDEETNENVKTNVLDFAAREEIENKARELLKQFGNIEFKLTTRAVTAEEFSEAAKKDPNVNLGTAADFYCIDGIMTVSGMPVTYGKNSYVCYDGVLISPTNFYAVFTENGLVDFELNNVWNVGGIINKPEILTLEDAEKIIAEKYPPAGRTPKKMIFSKAELFYRASYTKDGLRFIPCWGFYADSTDPKITVNAITGEML